MLTWTRHRPGYYTAGNFVIERLDTRYGPTWKLLIDGLVFSTTKKTLHECQAIAGSIAVETSLFTSAQLRADT